MIEVVDNFAPQDYFELIQNHVLSWNQEWYYQANITAGVFEKKGLGKHGFNCHVIRNKNEFLDTCLLYTSPSPRDVEESRMPSSA